MHLLFALAIGTVAEAAVTRPDQAPGTAAEVAAGAAVFQSTCARCHGEQGEGKAQWAPRLNDQKLLAAASNAFLEATVRKGRPATNMTAWDKESTHGTMGLTPEQVGQVVAFVRSWQTVGGAVLDQGPLRGDASRGGAVYARDCERCHGVRGSGVAGAGVTVGIGHEGYLDAADNGFIRAVWGRCADTTRLTPMAPLPAVPDHPVVSDPETVDSVIAWLRANAW